MHRHWNQKEQVDVKSKEIFYYVRCKYKCTKKVTLRAHFNRNHKELKETMLECDSCDYIRTKKDTSRMPKGMKHKDKLSNCDKCEYSYTKNDVLIMHKLRKYGGQELHKKLCELCDFTCLTTDRLRLHKTADHSGLEGPQGFICT